MKEYLPNKIFFKANWPARLSTSTSSQSTISNLVQKRINKKHFYLKQIEKFIKYLTPFNIIEFKKANWYLKIYHIIRVDIILFFVLINLDTLFISIKTINTISERKME